MNKNELLIVGGITLVGLFLLSEQSQEPLRTGEGGQTGGGGWSIFPQPKPLISSPPEPKPLISSPPEPITKKSVQPLTINFPTIDIPTPPPLPPLTPPPPPTPSGPPPTPSGGGSSMPVFLPDTSPESIRKHIIGSGKMFTGGEKIPVVTKKGEKKIIEIKKADIEVNIPKLPTPPPLPPLTPLPPPTPIVTKKGEIGETIVTRKADNKLNIPGLSPIVDALRGLLWR